MFRWLGEKYDGVRCVWHPSKLQLYPNILYIYTFIFLKKREEKKEIKKKQKEGEEENKRPLALFSVRKIYQASL